MALNRSHRKNVELYLNTKGCCFICLKCVSLELKNKRRNSKSESEFSSLSALFRYLYINVEETTLETDFNLLPQYKHEKWGRNITAELCEDCSKINGKVQELVQVIEVARMKIDYLLTFIREKMRDAGRTPSRMIRYYRRMTSDLISASFMKCADRLRKGLYAECSKIFMESQPKVTIERMDMNLQIKRGKSVAVTSFLDDEIPSPYLDSDSKTDRDVEIEGSSISDNEQVTTVEEEVCKDQPSAMEEKLFTVREIEATDVTLVEPVCKMESEEPSQKKFDLGVKKNDIQGKVKLKLKIYADSSHVKSSVFGKFSKNSSYLRDRIINESKKIKKIKRFNCGLCDKAFSHRPTVIQHRNAVHYKIRLHCKVPGCGKSFTGRAALNIHQGLEHFKEDQSSLITKNLQTSNNEKVTLANNSEHSSSPSKNTTDEGEGYCKICRKTYSNRYNLQLHHESVHLGIRKFKCDHCEKKFFFRKDMRKHRDAVHYHRRFKCIVSGCSAEFSTENHLRTHRKAVHPETAVPRIKSRTEVSGTQCKICHKTFSSEKSLKQHDLDIHMGVKRFECDICGKKFSRASAGKLHRDSVHLGIRHFCDFSGCGKNYSFAHQLITHQRIAHRGWPGSDKNPKSSNAAISSREDKTTAHSIKQELD